MATLLICAAAMAALAAIEVELPATIDNTVYHESAAGSQLSNGAGQYLFAGDSQLGHARRGLMAFDCSSIPVGSTILSARVDLYCSGSSGVPSDVSLHRSSAIWGEGASGAFETTDVGSPAEPGDATWTHRYFPAFEWTNSGGDFAPSPSATTTVVNIGPYSWGLNAELVNDVQGWIDIPESNSGWVLIGDEAVSGAVKRFDSRDHAMTSLQPKLVLEYLPPASCPGDVTGDRVVGIDDAAALINCWSRPASCNPAADLDASGDIGVGDVAEMISYWGTNCG